MKTSFYYSQRLQYPLQICKWNYAKMIKQRNFKVKSSSKCCIYGTYMFDWLKDLTQNHIQTTL